MAEVKAPDFSYYKPISEKQAEFHKSKAVHKLLIGGYRGGKTYPAIHEVLFTCFDQAPGCEYLVCRNTWDSLEWNVEKDLLKVADMAGAVKTFDKSNHNLYLVNGVTISFRPLTLTRNQFKGMNLCGFFIDDPDTAKYSDIIGFLYTRLTNPPGVKASYFSTIICANYEGHDWLWKKYVNGRPEGGDGLFAYWKLETKDNNTLDSNYISTLREIHSEAWMKRYVSGDLDSYVGLVYDEYDPRVHDKDLQYIDKNNEMIKITITDVGITHKSVVLNMACDFKKIYVYNEFCKANLRSRDLGAASVVIRGREHFRAHLIDPGSGKPEQTSGISVKDDLYNQYKLRYINADKSKKVGIEMVKNFLTVRDNDSSLYIDAVRCPNTVKEIENYRWKEPENSDFEELSYKEEPIKKDDDCVDCLRYGILYLSRFMRDNTFGSNIIAEKRQDLWDERHKKLKFYRDYPDAVTKDEDRRVSRITGRRLRRLRELHANGIRSLTFKKDNV